MKTHLYVATELAVELREARKKKGYRQEDLALDGFLSTGTISRIERGSVSVSRDKITFLSEQLGVKLPNYQVEEDEEDQVDVSLNLLSIENHLCMISTDDAWESLRKIHPENEYHRVWSLYLKGRYWERKGKSQKAKLVYLQVVENDDPELRTYNFIPACYQALGRISFYEAEMQEALEYVCKGIEKYYAEGEREHIYSFLSVSKAVYLEELNRNEEALLELEELWENRNKIDSRHVILSVYELKTRILTKLGRSEQAILLAKEGLTTARMNRMYDHASYLWIALGECYIQQQKLRNAEICFQSALHMSKQGNNQFFIPKIFLHLGGLYEQINSPQKAHEMFTSAVHISRKSSNKLLLADSLECLGDHYSNYEKKEKAKKSYEESLEISKNLRKSKGTSNILLKLASCYRYSNQTKYYALLDEHYQIYTSNGG